MVGLNKIIQNVSCETSQKRGKKLYTYFLSLLHFNLIIRNFTEIVGKNNSAQNTRNLYMEKRRVNLGLRGMLKSCHSYPYDVLYTMNKL